MTANNGVMAWKERLVQVLYIMVGLVIAFPILYALMILIYGSGPGFGRWSEPDPK